MSSRRRAFGRGASFAIALGALNTLPRRASVRGASSWDGWPLFESDSGHAPVLVEPILELLNPRPGQVVLDGTVGLGGHAAVLLPRLRPGGRYIGLDLDERMLAHAAERLAAPEHVRLDLVKSNYAEFPVVLEQLGLERVDAALLDLGVNTAQLDDAARGFSFQQDGPLDMRFDAAQARTALDLVNRLSESELADLFYEFGQEGASRKIAKRICQVRHEGRITTTRVLAAAVESVFSSGAVRQVGKVHPATRVFQALRVAVNREFENLDQFLSRILDFLSPNGTFAVISFHSLEDGRVKSFLRQAKADGRMEELTRRPLQADDEERRCNPRSRSAKLRAGRKIEG